MCVSLAPFPKQTRLFKTFLLISRAAGLPLSLVIEQFSRLRLHDNIWDGRTGRFPEAVIKKAPYDLWLHAVSVGEVSVAKALVDALFAIDKKLNIVISSTTRTGIVQAEKIIGKDSTVISSPIDLPSFTFRALDALKPKVYATVETELWPNIFYNAGRLGISKLILNGRISDRSFPNYLKLRTLFSPLLANMDFISVSTESYLERFVALGANRKKIKVTGNAKYAGLLKKEISYPRELAKSLNISKTRPVWVAGSIRTGEEAEVIRAHEQVLKEFPDCLLIIAPRHMKNVPVVEKEVEEHGLCYFRFSQGSVDDRSVCIVDTIGSLFEIYGLAGVAFVGGSIVPKGGQNIFEPAAWSCPVIFGPYMSNFEDAREIMKKHGAGVCVNNAAQLAEAVINPLKNREFADRQGKACRKALETAGKDAAEEQARIIMHVLKARQ